MLLQKPFVFTHFQRSKEDISGVLSFCLPGVRPYRYLFAASPLKVGLIAGWLWPCRGPQTSDRLLPFSSSWRGSKQTVAWTRNGWIAYGEAYRRRPSDPKPKLPTPRFYDIGPGDADTHDLRHVRKRARGVSRKHGRWRRSDCRCWRGWRRAFRTLKHAPTPKLSSITSQVSLSCFCASVMALLLVTSSSDDIDGGGWTRLNHTRAVVVEAVVMSVVAGKNDELHRRGGVYRDPSGCVVVFMR